MGGGEEPAPAGNPNPTTNAVQRIDTDTGALAATVELKRTPDGIAATDAEVFVFDKSGQALLPVDPDTNAIAEPLPLDEVGRRVERVAGRADSLFVTGGCPFGTLRCPVMSYDPATGSFTEVGGIATEEDILGNHEPPVDAFGDVWFLDTFRVVFPHSTLVRHSDGSASLTAAITLDTEEFPEARGPIFAVDERSLWVLAGTTALPDATSRAALGEAMALWRIDPDTNEIAAVVEVPIIHETVGAIGVGAGSLWIPDGADDAVLRIDQSTGAVQNVIRVGRAPIGAVFANDAVWVANSRDGTVSRIDPDTLDVSTTTVGGSPTGIVTTGDSVWVTVTP